MAEAALIDLYYADECRVSLTPVVPYAWQFRDEDVWMPSSQGPGLNCFGLLRRDNTLRFQTCTHTITAAFIVEQVVQACRPVWEERGLTLFFLPPYSPHLNLAETLWRKLKYEWLRPHDYLSFDTLQNATRRALAAVGSRLTIAFARPNYG